MLKRGTSIGKNAWKTRGEGCQAQQAWKSRKRIRMGNWKGKGKGKLKACERGLSREKKTCNDNGKKLERKRTGKILKMSIKDSEKRQEKVSKGRKKVWKEGKIFRKRGGKGIKKRVRRD
jgi:hypothetical protein